MNHLLGGKWENVTSNKHTKPVANQDCIWQSYESTEKASLLMLIIFQIFNRFSTAIEIGIFKELVRGKVKYGYVEQISSYKDLFLHGFLPRIISLSARRGECFVSHFLLHLKLLFLILWQYSPNCQTLCYFAFLIDWANTVNFVF